MSWDRYKQARPILVSIINFLSWAFVFSIVYAQSPLYTSNQNQYFLHGLAKAGYGNLEEDWLANTIDPTPVFSLLVSWSYRLFHEETIYYAIYALLFGVYLWSVLGIVDEYFGIKRSRTQTLIYLTLFLGAHSAAWRYFLSRLIGPDWTFLLEGGVAGQRLLGTVLQPSAFGVFLVLSIYLFIREKGYPALVVMGLALYFHPTYLLTAASLTLAYMWIVFRDKRRLREPILLGTISLGLVLPILVYVYLSFGMASSEALARAREILVHIRIPHHAVVSEWFNGSVVFQFAIISSALWLIRRSRLFQILFICTAVAVVLTWIQVMLNSNELALLFPWRISVVLVPLSFAIVLAFLVTKITAGFEPLSARNRIVTTIVSIAGVMVLAIMGATRFKLDLDQKESAAEAQMMNFVRENKVSGEVYLVPTKMQDFRLETGAPIYVDFKSIPYVQNEVQEWRQRVLRAGRFYREKSEACETLTTFFGEGITHVILEKYDPISDCSHLSEVYEDDHYGVYEIDLKLTY